jgi:hypothetical protein
MRRYLVTAAVVALAGALAVAPALAGKGGNGHGNGKGNGGGGTTSSATLTASPSPAVSGDTVVLSGCGYEFEPVELDVTNTATGATEVYWAGMWASGCFSTAFTAGDAGSYRIDAIQHSSPSGTVMASTSLEVDSQ